jgi:CheY-like chemotaxis protein
MRILVVDDNPARHAFFRRLYLGEEVVSVTSYWEAVDALSQGPFDIVQLDHDLGDYREPDVLVEMYVRMELNGFHVAHYIANDLSLSLRPKAVIVQSANEDGAKNIERVLTEAGIQTVLRPVYNTDSSSKMDLY